MLLTLWTFFTLSRRFDTRLVGFGFEALNGLAIAGGSGTFPRSKISVQFISRARIDVQGVQGAPKSSDSNGFDPGH